MALEFMKIPGLHKILTAEDFKSFLIGVDKLPDYRGADYSVYSVTEDARARTNKIYYSRVAGSKGGYNYEVCSHYKLSFADHYGAGKPFEVNNVKPLCVEGYVDLGDNKVKRLLFTVDDDGNYSGILTPSTKQATISTTGSYWWYEADGSGPNARTLASITVIKAFSSKVCARVTTGTFLNNSTSGYFYAANTSNNPTTAVGTLPEGVTDIDGYLEQYPTRVLYIQLTGTAVSSVTVDSKLTHHFGIPAVKTGISLNFDKNYYWGYNADANQMQRLDTLARGDSIYLRANRNFRSGVTYYAFKTGDSSMTTLEVTAGDSVAEHEASRDDGRYVYFNIGSSGLSSVTVDDTLLYHCGGFLGIEQDSGIYDINYKDGTIFPTTMKSGQLLATTAMQISSDVVFQRSKTYFIRKDPSTTDIRIGNDDYLDVQTPLPNYTKLSIGSEGMGYTIGMSLAQWRQAHTDGEEEIVIYEENSNFWRQVNDFVGTLTRDHYWYERHGENFPYVGFVAIATSKWNGQMIGGLYHCVEREYQLTEDQEHHYRVSDDKTTTRSKSYYEHHTVENGIGVNKYVERNGSEEGTLIHTMDENGNPISTDGTGLIYRSLDGDTYFQRPRETTYDLEHVYFTDQGGTEKDMTGIEDGAAIPTNAEIYTISRQFYVNRGDIDNGNWDIVPLTETSTETDGQLSVTGLYGRTTDTKYRVGQQYYLHIGNGVFEPIAPEEMYSLTNDVYFWYTRCADDAVYEEGKIYGKWDTESKGIVELDPSSYTLGVVVDHDTYVQDPLTVDGQSYERYYHLRDDPDHLYSGLAKFEPFTRESHSVYLGKPISGQADFIFEKNVNGELASDPELCVKLGKYSKFRIKQVTDFYPVYAESGHVYCKKVNDTYTTVSFSEGAEVTRYRETQDGPIIPIYLRSGSSVANYVYTQVGHTETFVDANTTWEERAHAVRPATEESDTEGGVHVITSYPDDYEVTEENSKVDYYDGYQIPNDLNLVLESVNGEAILPNAYYEKCHGMYVWEQYFIERGISATKPYDVTCFFKEYDNKTVLYLRWSDPKFMLHQDDITASPDAWARTSVYIDFDDLEHGHQSIQIAGEAGTNDVYSRDFLMIDSSTFKPFGSESVTITQTPWASYDLNNKLKNGIKSQSAEITITAVAATGITSTIKVKPSRLVWAESQDDEDYEWRPLLPTSNNSVALPGVRYYKVNELGHETMVGDLHPYVDRVSPEWRVKYQKDIVTYLRSKDGNNQETYSMVVVGNPGGTGSAEGNVVENPSGDEWYCLKVPKIPEITIRDLVRSGDFDKVFANDVALGGCPLPRILNADTDSVVNIADIDRVQLALPIEEGYIDVYDTREEGVDYAIIDVRNVGKYFGKYRSTDTQVRVGDGTASVGTTGDGWDVAPLPRDCLVALGDEVTAEELPSVVEADLQYYRKVGNDQVYMHVPDGEVKHPHYKMFILPNFVEAVGVFQANKQYFTLNRSTIEFDQIENPPIGSNIAEYPSAANRVKVYIRSQAAFPSSGDIFAEDYERLAIEVTDLVTIEALRATRASIYVKTTVPVDTPSSGREYKTVFQKIEPRSHSVTFRFKKCISKAMFSDLATDASKYWDESTLRSTLDGFTKLPANGTNINVSGTGLGNGNVDYGAYTEFCEHHIAQVVNTVHHAVKAEPQDTVIVDPDTGEETIIPADPSVKVITVNETVRVIDKFWIPSISQLGFNYIRGGSDTDAASGLPSEGTCLCVFDTGTVNWHRETGYAAKKAVSASGTSAAAVSWWSRTLLGDRYGGVVFNANDGYQPLAVDTFDGTNDAAKTYPVSIFFTIA